MQSYSYALCTPVANSVYVNIYVKNSFAYAENDEIFSVRHPTGVKSADFRSQLEASGVSSHTEELRYNETLCLGMTIYISYCSHPPHSIPLEL